MPVMWGNLGSSNGSEEGAKVREIAAKNMTPSQLETAQKLARECVRKKYKGVELGKTLNSTRLFKTVSDLVEHFDSVLIPICFG